MNYPPYSPYQSQGYLRYGQNPYQQMTIQQAAPQMQGYSPASMPVSSKEEALAAPADFSGAPMIFADFSHGKVYVKQWNSQKGAADFLVFAPAASEETEKEAQPENENYISKSDFRREMEKVYAEIESLRGAKTDEHDGE